MPDTKKYAKKIEFYIKDFKEKSVLFIQSSERRNREIYLLNTKEGLSYRQIAEIVSTIEPMTWTRVAQIVKAFKKKTQH